MTFSSRPNIRRRRRRAPIDPDRENHVAAFLHGVPDRPRVGQGDAL